MTLDPDPVHKTVLPNGLTLLVRENHAAPVAAVLAHVNVGYFNEPDEWCGLSHVIEHMFFKGTRRRPEKEQIAKEVRAMGGLINAGTYYDQTSYYIVTPSAHVEQALEIEADMFTGGLFDAEELASELEVIIQESNQKRDTPTYLLLQEMYGLAFDRHRIRRWRIGSDERLRTFRREDILAFIEGTYRPENIVLTVVGDVEAERIAEMALRSWGELPRGAVQRDVSPEEPPRSGFRYRRMTGAIERRLVEVGFPAPPMLHADAQPLGVLGALLSDGRSARLNRALKEEQRLVNASWAGYEGFSDFGVFTMGLESVGDDPLEAERALFHETRRIAEDPPTYRELERVKTRIESRRVYAEEEVLGVARNLAYYETLGGYHLADVILDRLRAVTADDVVRVAEQYLRIEQASLLEYLPGSSTAPERSPDDVEAALRERGSPAGKTVRGHARADTTSDVHVEKLASGATLLYRRRTDLPVVALTMLLPGGRRSETTATCGITNLALKASMKGTHRLSAAEVAEEIEALGGSIGMPMGADYFGYSTKLLSGRFAAGLEVLRQVVREPRFDDDEVEKEKQAIYGEIRRKQDNMSSRAIELFDKACYGDQPYGLPSSGLTESVERLTPDDLRAWHRRHVVGEGAVIAVVGDILLDDLVAAVEDLVPPGEQAPDSAQAEFLPPNELSEAVPRKQTASVLGFQGATAAEDERHALDLLSEITSGQAGRFFQAVRGENALAYTVTSFHRARRDSGAFVTYTSTAPENEEQARNLILRECERLREELVLDEELHAAKEAIRGEHIIGTQTFSAQAGELAVGRLFGRPVDAAEQYLRRIEEITPNDLREVAARYLTVDETWRGVVRGNDEQP